MSALEALEQITFDEFLDLIAERVKEKADMCYTCFETDKEEPMTEERKRQIDDMGATVISELVAKLGPMGLSTQ